MMENFATKEAAFCFNYLASVEVYNPIKHLVKIQVIDTTVNKNRWQVTKEALKRALATLIGKPLIAHPKYSEAEIKDVHKKPEGTKTVGRFIDAYTPDSYAVGVAEITDDESWLKIQSGEWKTVSPSITALKVDRLGSSVLVDDFVFEHVAFVPRGAYPNAQVLSTYAGQESSLRSFSAALTEKLEERTRMSQILEAGAIPFDPKTKADEGLSWDFNAADYDADQLKMACAWYDSANPDVKASYKLPHHLPDGKVVWRGVAAAMAALLGGRGGVDIPTADREAVYNHLKKHYAQFDKEPPAFHASPLIATPIITPKGETRKMGEDTHDEEKAELTVKVATLTAAVDRLNNDNKALQERLARFEAERKEAKIQELLALHASLGLPTSKDEYTKYQTFDETVINQLINEARNIIDNSVFSGASPKTKYTGEVPPSAEDRVRMRLGLPLKKEAK